MMKHKDQLTKRYRQLLQSEFLSRRPSSTSVIISVILHLIVAIILIIVLSSDPMERTPDISVTVMPISAKPIVQATVVSAKSVDHEVNQLDQQKEEEAQAEIQKQNELQAQKRLELLKKQKALAEAKAQAKREAQKKKKQEEQKRIEIQKQKQKEDLAKKKQLEALKSLGLQSVNQQITAENDALKALEMKKAHQQQILTEADRYKALIKQVIQANWTDPESLSANYVVWLKIIVNLKGEIQSVSVVKSSGNPIFDRQAVMAVKKTQTLPMPQSEELKTQFQNITLSFGGNE